MGRRFPAFAYPALSILTGMVIVTTLAFGGAFRSKTVHASAGMTFTNYQLGKAFIGESCPNGS